MASRNLAQVGVTIERGRTNAGRYIRIIAAQAGSEAR
jgi:hypothetical protein